MPCNEFEDLLADHAGIAPAERLRADAHLQECAACRRWFEALAEIDMALSSEFEGVHAPATLAINVQRRLAASLQARVSAVPEILDFAGWLGVIGAAGMLAYFLLPSSHLVSTAVLISLAGVLLCFALSVSVWILVNNEV